MKEPDLDPGVDAAYRKLMDAADRLETARIRVERIDVDELFNAPTVVDDEFMLDLATRPTASAELKAYAARVDLGDAQWRDIERLGAAVPAEVLELKASPRFLWRWTPAPFVESPDDDFGDEWPPKSWLV